MACINKYPFNISIPFQCLNYLSTFHPILVYFYINLHHVNFFIPPQYLAKNLYKNLTVKGKKNRLLLLHKNVTTCPQLLHKDICLSTTTWENF